jgi:hypothetical protein
MNQYGCTNIKHLSTSNNDSFKKKLKRMILILTTQLSKQQFIITRRARIFVRIFSKRFLEILEIGEAEAWGMREALHWLSIIDMENATIEIESDYP